VTLFEIESGSGQGVFYMTDNSNCWYNYAFWINGMSLGRYVSMRLWSLSVIPLSFSAEKSLGIGREKCPDWLSLARLFLELNDGLDFSLCLWGISF